MSLIPSVIETYKQVDRTLRSDDRRVVFVFFLQIVLTKRKFYLKANIQGYKMKIKHIHIYLVRPVNIPKLNIWNE